jgi:hypothetical protein
MGDNIAGIYIYGAQIFRQEDRPFYRRGFSISSPCCRQGRGVTRGVRDT